MIAKRNSSTSERPASIAAQLHCLQAALAGAGGLQGVHICLKSKDSAAIAILEDGELIPLGVRDGVEQRCPENGCPSLAIDSSNALLIWDQSGEGSRAMLVRSLLQAALRQLELEQREGSLLEELGASWESLEALYEISTSVLRSGNVKEALGRLVDRLATLQAGLHAGLFVEREGVFEPWAAYGSVCEPLAPEQLGAVARAIDRRQVILSNNFDDAPDARACWRTATRLAVAPILCKQKSIGFVIVWREDYSAEFDSPFSRVLEAITYQASMILESDALNRKVRETELLAQEIEIASSIQQTLLLANAPKAVPGLEIAACSVPSQSIDGDFYEFFQHPDGTVDVLIGDVMGKGLAAALLGAATKSQFLRATANLALRSREGAPRPVDIVTRAASRLCEQLITVERFVTLCYARFAAATQELVFVDCGHTSAILDRKSDGECRFLRGCDLPLGLFATYECEEQSFGFRPGDTYLFYSDGVTENPSPDGEMFGPERLAECLQNWSSLGPALLIEQIRKEAARFKKSEKFSDDFTCIAVRVKIAPPAPEPVACRTEVFACDSEELPRFRAWLLEAAAAGGEGLREEGMARAELACTELFTNCIYHGAAPEAHPIRVESRAFAGHLEIRIIHRGPAFDPLSVPPPTFDGSREGGFGTYIVLRSADQAAYERDTDGTNVITVSFLRNPQEQSHDSNHA